ncbi:MAG TPA: DUF1003 domain-containing protein [Mycobacteriales bacterium]|nr:DUF1003 domain-containing protein [Mycobacteriales bacterium]
MAERAARRPRLDTPVQTRRTLVPRPHYDPDTFGRFSERIARFLGTAKFLVYMTVFIVVWVLVNVTPVAFDPYTFTFLTLLLSLQASYAAPLILLAQNRQTDRDRVSMDEDRAQNARLMAEVEYLTRELASLRQAVGEVPTRDYLREQLHELTEEVVARSGETAGKVLYDRAARDKREERERRAERKRRATKQRGEEGAATGVGSVSGSVGGSLGEPFAGESSE